MVRVPSPLGLGDLRTDMRLPRGGTGSGNTSGVSFAPAVKATTIGFGKIAFGLTK